MKLNPASVQLHASMLNDRQRTSAYIAALEESVRPRDVVVDIGTGTGILALAALRAGASIVYAIEGERATAALAKRMIAANHASAAIEVIHGWSSEVSLPKKADVVVAELLGHEAFAEGISDFMSDAISRLLKPTGKTVPSSVNLFLQPVQLRLDALRSHGFFPKLRARWETWYGFNFTPLAQVNEGHIERVLLPTRMLRSAQPLTEEVQLASVVFRAVRTKKLKIRVELPIRRSGILNGLLSYFTAHLSRTQHLSTKPADVRRDHHWLTPVWILSVPIRVKKGQKLLLHYEDDIATLNPTVFLDVT